MFRERSRTNPTHYELEDLSQEQPKKEKLPPVDIPKPIEVETSAPKRQGGGCLLVLAVLVIVVFVSYALIRPGVFTIQPIGALPEGITIIYHSRGDEMPFFSSPDGLCLQIQGSVNLLCRLTAMSAVTQIADRILIRLPYSRWAYLQSTGGVEFEQ